WAMVSEVASMVKIVIDRAFRNNFEGIFAPYGERVGEQMRSRRCPTISCPGDLHWTLADVHSQKLDVCGLEIQWVSSLVVGFSSHFVGFRHILPATVRQRLKPVLSASFYRRHERPAPPSSARQLLAVPGLKP